MNNKASLLSIFIIILFLRTDVYAFYSDSSISQINRLLAKTINIGYTIEFNNPGGLQDSLSGQLEKLKIVGFTAVRLPINWISAMDSSASWVIQPSFQLMIDQVIKKALDLHLAVILDNHSDEQLMDNPARYGVRIIALWKYLSDHFKKCPESVMFELLAEPHGNLSSYWNMLIKELLKTIRAGNPTRAVIIGPVNFNRPDFLYQLQLPENDQFIIVSFHQYSPVKFTMQGETWFPFGRPLEWLGTTWPQKSDEEFLLKMFDQVDAWAKANHRPIFLGEFGVSSMADIASASRWIRFNRSEAEKRGFTWGFWSCFGLEFSLYKTEKQSWNTQFIEDLIPNLNQ